MRTTGVVTAAFLVLLTLVSCNRQPAEQRQATVVLKDGSQVSGKVAASSDTEITLAGDDSITRTIPMSQVKSVEYGEAALQPEALVPAEAQPAPPTPEPKRAAAPAPLTRAQQSEPAQAKERSAPPSRPSPLARTFTLPSGAELPIRTNETIDSAKAAEGQLFAAEVSGDVLNSEGAVVIPKGAQAEVVIVSASQGGKIRGASDLVLSLASVTVRGRRHQLEASDVARHGKEGVGANKRTATYTGGGAAVGAIIGAIAGGGKGAAIGAGAGAGAGALTQILTRGKAIRVPAESGLTFQLESPLTVAAE
ncbi:MAG TPA: hypothetical protein VLH09_07455 [Bryobacteraceae bacterium]|nr:hypothetical protein [Bryobacteraceae bacterium]